MRLTQIVKCELETTSGEAFYSEHSLEIASSFIGRWFGGLNTIGRRWNYATINLTLKDYRGYMISDGVLFVAERSG